MTVHFSVQPYQGCMDVKIVYERDEIKQEFFYLNRDFVITRCLADEVQYDISDGAQMTSLDEFDDYAVQKYFVPAFDKQLTLEYVGTLSGRTGCYPYVRETISPEFTFIRWETFCYPIFISESITPYQFLVGTSSIGIAVSMPDEFIAVACVPMTTWHVENGVRTQGFFSDRNDIAIAIAGYVVEKLSIGTFYLLNEANSGQVEKSLTAAHGFMNEHFGIRDIPRDINYAAIPNQYGSFASNTTVFVDESTFESAKTMHHMIHEFIHLGWNVKAEEETQKIRFFDEAFTSYFEMRVMEYLTKDNYRFRELMNGYQNQLNSFDGDVPIVEFGKHRYGDLSYTIGAVCLYKLSELVGIELFEDVTKKFLQKYRNIPVTMELFCNEYMRSCKNPELEHFFDDWIYSVNGPKSFVASYKE